MDPNGKIDQMECKVVVYRDDCKIEKSSKRCEVKVSQVKYTYQGSEMQCACAHPQDCL